MQQARRTREQRVGRRRAPPPISEDMKYPEMFGSMPLEVYKDLVRVLPDNTLSRLARVQRETRDRLEKVTDEEYWIERLISISPFASDENDTYDLRGINPKDLYIDLVKLRKYDDESFKDAYEALLGDEVDPRRTDTLIKHCHHLGLAFLLMFLKGAEYDWSYTVMFLNLLDSHAWSEVPDQIAEKGLVGELSKEDITNILEVYPRLITSLIDAGSIEASYSMLEDICSMKLEREDGPSDYVDIVSHLISKGVDPSKNNNKAVYSAANVGSAGIVFCLLTDKRVNTTVDFSKLFEVALPGLDRMD